MIKQEDQKLLTEYINKLFIDILNDSAFVEIFIKEKHSLAMKCNLFYFLKGQEIMLFLIGNNILNSDSIDENEIEENAVIIGEIILTILLYEYSNLKMFQNGFTE